MQAKLWLLGSAGDPREAREGQGRDRIDDEEEEEKSESEEGKKERKKESVLRLRSKFMFKCSRSRL